MSYMADTVVKAEQTAKLEFDQKIDKEVEEREKRERRELDRNKRRRIISNINYRKGLDEQLEIKKLKRNLEVKEK